ncbi:MAG: hypothetical protein WC683_09995 [bacterium]
MRTKLTIGGTKFDSKRMIDFDVLKTIFAEEVEGAMQFHKVEFKTDAQRKNFRDLVAHNCAFEAVTQ